MNCNDIISKLTLYIDNKLSKEETASFKAHVSGCSKCAKLLKETQDAIKKNDNYVWMFVCLIPLSNQLA